MKCSENRWWTFRFYIIHLRTPHKHIQVKHRSTKSSLNPSEHSFEYRVPVKIWNNQSYHPPLYLIWAVFLCSVLLTSLSEWDQEGYPGWFCLCASTDCRPLARTLHKGQVCRGSCLTNALPEHVSPTDRRKGKGGGGCGVLKELSSTLLHQNARASA